MGLWDTLKRWAGQDGEEAAEPEEPFDARLRARLQEPDLAPLVARKAYGVIEQRLNSAGEALRKPDGAPITWGEIVAAVESKDG